MNSMRPSYTDKQTKHTRCSGFVLQMVRNMLSIKDISSKSNCMTSFHLFCFRFFLESLPICGDGSEEGTVVSPPADDDADDADD